VQGRPIGAWTWFAIAAATAYVFWDVGRAFNLTDEFWYAQITREMLASGDWLTPQFAGEPDFNKPPLYFWLSAAFLVAFPDEVAMRIVPGLSFLGILLLLRRTVSRELGSRAGLLCVLAFALTADHLLHHGYKSGVVDGLLNLEMTAIFALALDLPRHPRRLRWIGLLLGLTFLTKTAFVVFPAALVGFQVVRLSRAGVLRPVWIAQAIGLGGGIAGAWLAALWLENGPRSVMYLLGDQALARLMGDQAAYSASGRVTGRGEPLYVVRHLLTWAQPWIWVALLASVRLLTQRRRRPPQIAVLASLWFAGVIALFSASAGRWPWYTSSALVPMAILAAWLLDDWLRGSWDAWTRSLVPVTAASLLVLGIPMAYNPFARQATCAPLDAAVGWQLAILALLIAITLRGSRDPEVSPALARLQLGLLGTAAFSRIALLGLPRPAAPLYTNGGRCGFPWPEMGSVVPPEWLIGIAILAATALGIALLRRSVPLGCSAALLTVAAGYVAAPTIAHGLHPNERAEVRWMRSAIARGSFERGEELELTPSNVYLSVILHAEFGDQFEIRYDAASLRTRIRARDPIAATSDGPDTDPR